MLRHKQKRAEDLFVDRRKADQKPMEYYLGKFRDDFMAEENERRKMLRENQ